MNDAVTFAKRMPEGDGDGYNQLQLQTKSAWLQANSKRFCVASPRASEDEEVRD